MADKEIIIDGLGCNNCPEIGRCREQQERKDAIISTLLYSLLDTDNERIISNLKELIPKITRCDVVLEKQLKRAEQEIDTLKTQLLAAQTMEFEENAKLKAEIKSAKEMLIQNDCRTNRNTLPQIIEEFMSDNLLDAQDEEGYTIPVFKQVENKLETLEDLEQECETLKSESFTFEELIKTQEELIDKYEQALDEIEKFIKSDMCEPCEESKGDPLEECNHSCEECNYKIILDTVNEAKEL